MRKIGACLVLIAALIGVNAATAAGATDAGQAAGRGLEIGVPVYRFHGDPYLTELESAAMTPVPPSVVILNIDNGDSDVSQLDADADALRARVGGNGEHVKVIGYVHTDFATRSIADVERSVDRWLSPRDGGVHYDGIFFDQVTRDCGPAADSTAYRDYYRALREYVWDKIPASSDLVVDNVGSAVSDCYLAPGRDTADTFVTFEGSQVDYADNWVGGNIIADGGYSLGEAYPSWRFWHIIYSAGSADYKTVLSDSFNRYAGMATV
ncbi:MAG TPA: spherulation-specific family 4 protein, partial [Pseudonocardiaceae bacterium]|nr:spherulation-specific family 4 protein [Pseudonocardiaceae bacterium]